MNRRAFFIGLTFVVLTCVAAAPVVSYAQDAERWDSPPLQGSTYLSKDGGKTWEEQTGLKGKRIAGFVFGQDNKDVAYAYGDGIYRSTEGKDNWQKLAIPEKYIEDVVTAPKGAVYLCSDGRVQLSENGGDTWSLQTPSGGPRQIAVDPQTGRLFGVSGNATGECRIVTSTDKGKTWSSLHEPRDFIWCLRWVEKSETLYVLIDNALCLIGEDSGKKWEKSSKGIGEEVNIMKGDLRINPENDKQLFAILWLSEGGQRSAVGMSEDGGQSWQEVESLPDLRLEAVHTTWVQRWVQLAFSKDCKSLFAASMNGLYRLDLQNKKSERIEGLPGGTINAMAVNPSSGSICLSFK